MGTGLAARWPGLRIMRPWTRFVRATRSARHDHLLQREGVPMTRLPQPRRLTLAAALCVLAGAAACNEDNTPPTDSSPGTLTVVVNATGTSLDNQFTIE